MSGEPFMPTAEMTDEMLIDTGREVITWGELQARKSVSCAAVKGLETHARELAHRIIMEFRPNGWEAKEDELYRLLLGHFESLTAPPARTYAEGDWKPIADFDMTNVGPNNPVIVAVTCEERKPVIGEAYFDPEAYEGTWWWAGLSYGEYHDSPIEEMQHGTVTHFQPMPTFPAIRLLSQGEKA